MPMIVPLRPSGTVKLSLTLTTLSNRRYSASRSGTTPCCCSNGCRQPSIYKCAWAIDPVGQKGPLNTKGTHSEKEMRLHRHTHFLGALLYLHEMRQWFENWGRTPDGMKCNVCTPVTLAFSTASSILSTMAASSTCSSQDVLVTELTGWLFNHEVISATFSALYVQH